MSLFTPFESPTEDRYRSDRVWPTHLKNRSVP